jgi:hypothetical protein
VATVNNYFGCGGHINQSLLWYSWLFKLKIENSPDINMGCKRVIFVRTPEL